MSVYPCIHCGQAYSGDDPYCQNCGALRESEVAETATHSFAETALVPQGPEGFTGDLPESNSESETGTAAENGETTGANKVSDGPLLLNVLAGLIPERVVDHFPPNWAQAQGSSVSSDNSILQEMKSRFGISGSLTLIQPTGIPHSESLRKQWWLYGAILLAALLSFWLGSMSLPNETYDWGGTEAAWQAIQELEPGSNVLIYWQNHPAVAGELDLPVVPVLTHLLAVPVDLHFFTQHPLGLAEARRLLAMVRRRQAIALSENETSAIVHEIGYWPGGYVVLPGLLSHLAKIEPDLHIVITADADDVIHWLEQVGPHTAVPILAVTGAGVDQVIRPYQDSEQLAGLVRGYNGAQAYAQLNADRFPNLQRKKIQLHMAAQNWISAALILAFLASLLLRLYAIPSWEQTELDS